jgi:hypothetical protein
LAGNYGVIAQGAITPGGPLPASFVGPFAQVGLLNFDDQGNFSFAVVNSLNGQVQPLATVKGRISVNADCSVSLLDEQNIALRGTVLNGGDEILLTPVTPGFAVVARGFRVKPNSESKSSDNPFERARSVSCTNGTLSGIYGFDALGATTAAAGFPAPLTGAFSGVGQVSYDGAGNVTLTAVASFNGFSQALPSIKGTYFVNDDCTFTSRLENGLTFFAVAVNKGQELLVIQTNNGVTAVGVAKKLVPPADRNTRAGVNPGGSTNPNPGNPGDTGSTGTSGGPSTF